MVEKKPRADPFGWVGHVLAGKYRVDSVVGEGGFGVVYRAHHLGFEQAVALKCLKLKASLTEEAKDEFLKRFIAEGKLLHRLSRATADVVQCLDVGFAVSPADYETPYLVLEWLDGTTLDRELRKSRGEKRTLEDAMAWLEPAARGLSVAHDQGVSHRDVKPANFMVTDVGGRPTLKVVDFGIAKAPDDSPTTSPSQDDGFGSAMQAFTPRYGAPEQFSRKYGPTGPWTDVYSFALVLVEMVTGHPALEGEDPVQLYIETSDVQRRPTLRARGAEVSDAVESVVGRALAVDPRSRHRTMGEFWDALHAAVGTQGTRIKSVRPPALSKPSTTSAPVFNRAEPDLVAPTHTGNVGTITVMVREQRKRKIAWVLALLGTGFIVGGALFKMNQKDDVTLGLPDAAPSSLVPAPPASSAPPPVVAAVPTGMLPVAAATFTMGADDGAKGDRPAHPVTLTRAFFIDRTEVTAEAYGVCILAGACTPNALRKDGPTTTSSSCNSVTDPNFARQPVNCISYDQAAAYCKFVSKRLPTEAEWELAARGTDGRSFPWGNTAPTSCRQAIVGGLEGPCGSRKGTFEVGTTVDGTSPVGAFDMAGNVWEWVADAYDAYPKERVVDPFLPPRVGTKGILRGGSWDYSATTAKTTTRLPIDRSWGQPSIGFRCAK